MQYTKTTLAAAVLIGALQLVPATAFAQEATGTAGTGSGRLFATCAAVIGLAGAVWAGWLFFRHGKGGSRRAAIVTSVTGLCVVGYAVLHLFIFTGNFGTGDGRAGAIFAIIFGLTCLLFSGINLRRLSRFS